MNATNSGRSSGIKQDPPKQRLIDAGKSLFADRGFKATSVRDICDRAGTSSTMIHHYFGNKAGLFDAIIEQFSSQTFAMALRVISQPARSPEDFKIRLEMFISETLEALISQEMVFRIMRREQTSFVEFTAYRDGFIAFLEAAKKSDYLRSTIEIDMITGFILDRIGNQVLYGTKSASTSATNIIINPEYRARWLRANSDILINGLAADA